MVQMYRNFQGLSSFRCRFRFMDALKIQLLPILYLYPFTSLNTTLLFIASSPTPPVLVRIRWGDGGRRWIYGDEYGSGDDIPRIMCFMVYLSGYVNRVQS